ncbi:MAG: histone deacetylase [Bacteroidota bacterium]
MLKIAWSPIYQYPLPEGHRFPMEKYQLIPEQLMYEGTVSAAAFYEPEILTESTVLLTHEEAYWQKLIQGTLSPREARKTGFPFSPLLVKRGRMIASGSLQNVFLAQQHGIAMNIAGGTHHAYADHGEGFCLLNDFAIAANYLLEEGLISRILVVDLDVHQGNGTAHIFQQEPRVFTFSMHCEANYPMKKEQSDLDIGLQLGTEDDAYLASLTQTLPALIDQVEPELVMYLAGVDILQTDKLGKLACTIDGCKARDAFVLNLCHRHQIPVIVSLGGGYSPRIRDIVEAHSNTFRLAQEIWF